MTEVADGGALVRPYSIVYGSIEAHAQGYFPGMENRVYHAQAGLSASGAKHMLRSMLHYRTERQNPSPTTRAKKLGIVIHLGALEPERLDDLFAVEPEGINKRTTEGKERIREFYAVNAGKTILDPRDAYRAKAAVESVRSHPAAMRLLAGAETEGSCFWENRQYRIPCRMRFDLRNRGILGDVKSTQDASATEFGKDCASFMYHMQSAIYLEGHREVFGIPAEAFIFIAVETEPPFAVACYAATDSDVLAGRHLFMEAAARYKRAIAYDEYPGYPEEIQKLQLPRWAKRHDVY